VTVNAAEARQILLRDGAENLQDRSFGGYNLTTTMQTVQQPVQPVQPVELMPQATTHTTAGGNIRMPTTRSNWSSVRSKRRWVASTCTRTWCRSRPASP